MKNILKKITVGDATLGIAKIGSVMFVGGAISGSAPLIVGGLAVTSVGSMVYTAAALEDKLDTPFIQAIGLESFDDSSQDSS